MNNLNTTSMEKKLKHTKIETTSIEIIYNDSEDLKKLYNREEFIEFILEDSFKTIEMALENKLDKVELFNIFNLSLVVELEKSNYKNVLNNLVKHCIDIEDYERCSLIQNILKKYEI
tara:strand:+ start:177 stop:527 length:351 start_codon:yes stop_codon:yes gene_type:complete